MQALRLMAHGWRDISWFDELLERIADSGRGELWFVAGNPRGVLDQVRERARDAPNSVVVGPGPAHIGHEVRDAVAGTVGTALGVINPLAELVLVLGDAGMRIARNRKAAPRPGPPDVFGLFDDLVRTALADGGTVVFIVDAKNRDEELWNRRFTQYTARAGRLGRQRLAMIVGLADAPVDVRDVDETFPALVRDAASIVADRKAHWHGVPPLSAELVTEVLPVTLEVARLLVTVTGGDDHLAEQRWSRWVDEGVLRRDGGAWSLTGDPGDHVQVGIERAFNLVFGTDQARVNRAQLALTLAGFVGTEFCCETVLRSMAFAGEDRDAAEEDIDALVGDGDRFGLLHVVGYDHNQPGKEPDYLWRYRFDDPAVAVFFRTATKDDAERERYIRSLLSNLVELRLQHGVFDTAIGRLAREAGDDASAKMIEHRVATRQEQTHLEIDSAVLLAQAQDWDVTDLYLCEQLTAATDRLCGVGLTALAVTCGTAALNLARAHPDPPQRTLADAFYYLGIAHWLRGELDQAIGYLSDANIHSQALFDQLPTPSHRGNLAATLHKLGTAHLKRGDVDQAIGYLSDANIHSQALFDQHPTPKHRGTLAATLHEIGAAHVQRGEIDDAMGYLSDANIHSQALFDQQPTRDHRGNLAATLHETGAAHLRRSEVDQAIGYFSQAHTHNQALYDNYPVPDHRRRLAVTVHALGAAHLRRGEVDQAIGYLSEAHTHSQALFDQQSTRDHRIGLALTLHEIGAAHLRRGEVDQAIGYLSEAHTHNQALFDQHPTPWQRHQLDKTLAVLRDARASNPQGPGPKSK